MGLSEYNPFEAVQTNILGVKNVIQVAMRQGVEKVIFTSSDKAVNPTNVMGTTELIGERLVTGRQHRHTSRSNQRFSSVRFGGTFMGEKGFGNSHLCRTDPAGGASNRYRR